MTSLLIGGVALAAGACLHSVSGWAVPAALLVWLGWANLLLGVLNLLPAVPLDGGRVLHAAPWWRTGERERAEPAADRGGQVVGMLLIAVGWLAFPETIATGQPGPKEVVAVAPLDRSRAGGRSITRTIR